MRCCVVIYVLGYAHGRKSRRLHTKPHVLTFPSPIAPGEAPLLEASDELLAIRNAVSDALSTAFLTHPIAAKILQYLNGSDIIHYTCRGSPHLKFRRLVLYSFGITPDRRR